MSTKARRHAHKYYFGLEVSGTKVWACALPDCSHYMPKHLEGLVANKRTICWKCEEEFILLDVDIPKFRKTGKPICNECALLSAPDLMVVKQPVRAEVSDDIIPNRTERIEDAQEKIKKLMGD